MAVISALHVGQTDQVIWAGNRGQVLSHKALLQRAAISDHGIRDKSQQIRRTDIDACLRKQRRCLSTMVRLVIEKVDEQTVEIPVCLDTRRVAVRQNRVQIGFGQFCRPPDNHLIDHRAPGLQCIQLSKQQLIQRLRVFQMLDRFKARVPGRMAGKTLEPNGIGHNQMIQRANDRTEKRLAVSAKLVAGKPSRSLINLIVHPAVVVGHQLQMLDSVHGTIPMAKSLYAGH